MNFDELHHHCRAACSFLMGDPYQIWECNSLGMVVRLTGEDVNFDESHHHFRSECSFLMGYPY